MPPSLKGVRLGVSFRKRAALTNRHATTIIKDISDGASLSGLQQPTGSVRADEELINPKRFLEDRCKPVCVKYLVEYGKCVDRIKDDESANKHCTGQYFDYWSCTDKCVASKLFEKLK